MGVEHGALIFGVELCADVPLESRNLYYLHEVALWVASYAHHARLLILLLEVVVELIAVAVALLYVLLLIYVEHT